MMLDCRSKNKRERQKRFRNRQRCGEFCCIVPVDGQIVDFLVRHQWLREADAHDPKQVGAAIRALLELSAKL
jgi:hypothetical protein